MAAQERQQPRTPHRTARRTSTAPESDKDSGFSDVASECLSSVEQTDCEDTHPPPRRSTAQKPSGGPQPRPLLLLKNLLVDQGSGSDPHPHSWTVRPSFQLLPTSSQILVFPPPVPPSREKPAKYLPILNSYPKIAPHPSQQPARGDKREAESRHQNHTKRRLPGPSCSSASETLSSIVSEVNAPDEGLLDEVLTCSSQGPAQTDARDHLGLDGSDARSAPRSVTSHKTDLSKQNKNRRFQNTLDILHRSGLLSIAIKTKELARLNQATQRQLERLQEQVSMYTRASSTNRPEDWQALQDLLAEGSGPITEMGM